MQKTTNIQYPFVNTIVVVREKVQQFWVSLTGQHHNAVSLEREKKKKKAWQLHAREMNLIIFIVLLQVKNVILFTGECTSNDWANNEKQKRIFPIGRGFVCKGISFLAFHYCSG